MHNYHFFLGGHDAEMVEIRNILESHDIPFYDRQLSWGAALSAYREEIAALPPDAVPVFVELTPDIPAPDGAVIIDHHNERAGKWQKTAIQQTADLLEIELTRRQRLISANDRGHIRAMRTAGASPAEIEDIRAFDRKSQGVTEADERLAARSIENNLTDLGCGAAWIDSRTDRTSPIADRLFDHYEHLFIATPKGELLYFGRGYVVQRLKSHYDKLKKDRPDLESWSGGDLPEYGFFGATQPLSKTEAADFTLVSQHLFMFPFTIEAESGESADRDFMETVEAALPDQWGQRTFSPAKSNQRYSEYYYFHRFVREALYGTPDTGESDLPALMTYYTRPVPEGSRFILHVRKGDETTIYELELRRIALRIYDTRIGVLSLELANRAHEEMDDILKINDFGRRIYPQFLGDRGTDDTKGAFLPDRVTLKLGDHEIPEPFDDAGWFRKDHPVVARYISELLGDRFTTDPDRHKKQPGALLYRPTIDDRMYVVCWYGSDEWSDRLKWKRRDGDHAYLHTDMWYRFIFLDGNDLTCQHPEMRTDLLRKATYERWADYGTLFGISRYSLVCAAGSEFGYFFLRQHMRRHYGQMAALLLAQRASILRFSDEVTRISRRIKGLSQLKGSVRRRSVEDIQVDVEQLHADYIRFVNRMWFTEITPHDQGIEIYNKATETMHLKDDMADLKGEIKELYEFISMLQDRTTNLQVSKQTILGTIFLPLVVLTGFCGMDLKIIDNTILERLAQLIMSRLMIVETETYRRIAEVLKADPPGSFAISAFHWGLSLAVLIGCYGVIRYITRRIIIRLDDKDSDILEHLKIRNWFKRKP